MGESQQDTFRDHSQQNYRCLVLGGCLFLQHHTLVHHLNLGKLDLGTILCVLLSTRLIESFL